MIQNIGLYSKKNQVKNYFGVRKLGKLYAVPFMDNFPEKGMIPIMMEYEDWVNLPLA